jgi:hypothetical protein
MVKIYELKFCEEMKGDIKRILETEAITDVDIALLKNHINTCDECKKTFLSIFDMLPERIKFFANILKTL